MASSSPDVNLTRAKELGKYTKLEEPSIGKAQEKNRSLDDEVNVMRVCAGSECGKHVVKVKAKFVCSCKKAIHCSRDCLKSSSHKCGDSSSEENSATPKKWVPNTICLMKNPIVVQCHLRYLADKAAYKGPSSAIITRILNMTKRNHQRILNYAERGNPAASYIVGSAYAERVFERKNDFAISIEYKVLSVAETDEIAVKWLKVATEGGVPEAMFLLFMIQAREERLRMDPRVAYHWLVQAHATGEMDYLVNILESPMWSNFPAHLTVLHNQIIADSLFLHSQLLAGLLLAIRYRELVAWNGKTGMGQPFYGRIVFNKIMESVGEVKERKSYSYPNHIDGEKKKFFVIPARPGHADFVEKVYNLGREENNLKFRQGLKEKTSPDYQLAGQTSKIEGRTSYLITCKHDEVQKYTGEEKATHVELDESIGAVLVGLDRIELGENLVDFLKSYKEAGDCEQCSKEAKQRLRAVSLGLFSMSLLPIYDLSFYAARYSNEDGVIVQDIFSGYTKPFMKQVLQCLMSNPADLHPLAVAEDANLFWPIIWFWGSMYRAVHDTCNETTLDAIYQSLGQCLDFSNSENVSAMAAFPDSAAGEWRIACGNEKCPRVDHEVKFNICKGCKVRRYCDEACQKEDWPKHMKFCKAAKKEGK